MLLSCVLCCGAWLGTKTAYGNCTRSKAQRCIYKITFWAFTPEVSSRCARGLKCPEFNLMVSLMIGDRATGSNNIS